MTVRADELLILRYVLWRIRWRDLPDDVRDATRRLPLDQYQPLDGPYMEPGGEDSP